jgi:uncharacterized membrane protein
MVDKKVKVEHIEVEVINLTNVIITLTLFIVLFVYCNWSFSQFYNNYMGGFFGLLLSSCVILVTLGMLNLYEKDRYVRKKVIHKIKGGIK